MSLTSLHSLRSVGRPRASIALRSLGIYQMWCVDLDLARETDSPASDTRPEK